MATRRLSDVQLDVARLLSEGKGTDALALAESVRDAYPRHRARVGLWIAETAALIGWPEAAVGELARMEREGLWVGRSQWQHEPPFQGLSGNAEFAAVMDRLDRMGAGLRGEVRLQVFQPTKRRRPSFVLLVLHGVAEARLGSAPLWQPATAEGGLVLVPESPEITTSDGTRGWINRELGLAEAQRVLRERSDTERRLPLVLAGFSGGANLAIDWATRARLLDGRSARGFVALCPGYDWPLPDLRTAVQDRVRGVGLTGEVDWARPVAEGLFSQMSQAGLDVQLEILSGEGHGYPPHFREWLRAAVRSLTN